MYYSKTLLSLFALTTTMGFGIGRNDGCPPEPPAKCNLDTCQRCHCLGPETFAVNAPVRPLTCNGDLFINISGFYWKANEDGLEYAIENDNSAALIMGENNHILVNSDFKSPNFDWEFGFKAGFGYNSPCDGWDIGLYWTRYDGRASSHIEAEDLDSQSILPIWSNLYAPTFGGISIFATDSKTDWKLQLNLIDIELGRESWNSRYLTLRPHVGIRLGYIDQDYDIIYSGGSWSDSNILATGNVKLENDFKGVGLRGGLDSIWNLGCGWALYADFALSLMNGRFKIDHEESLRGTESPFNKDKLLETSNSFHSTKMIADFAFGLQWSSLICDCKYGLLVALGYEQHLFFDQNQLWRIAIVQGNETEEFNNIYQQGRGDLSTQGWTLSAGFDF